MIEIINGAKVLTSLDTNSTILRAIVIPHSENEYTVVDYLTLGKTAGKIQFVKTVNTETFDVHVFKTSEDITEDVVKESTKFIKYTYYECKFYRLRNVKDLARYEICKVLDKYCDAKKVASNIVIDIENNEYAHITCGIIDYNSFVKEMKKCGVGIANFEPKDNDKQLTLGLHLINQKSLMKVKAVTAMRRVLGMTLKESKDILDDLTADFEYRLTVNIPTNTENLPVIMASFIEEMNECGVFVRQIITK